MTGNAFDALTRHAADGVSRRTSLLAMGGAALTAAVAKPTLTQAGKAGKKAKKKCKKQGKPCREFGEIACEAFVSPPDVEDCIAAANECCQSLTKCKGNQFFVCVISILGLDM